MARELYPDFDWSWVPTKDTPALLFDIECNGLLDTVTTIHCICAKDVLTGQTFSYGPDTIAEGLELLSSAPLIVAHNGLCFDAQVIHKLYPEVPLPRCFDTLTAAKLIWVDQLSDIDFARIRKEEKQGLPIFPKKLIGSQSLKAWGYRLREYKGDYGEVTENAWDKWSPEMQAYCEQDVEVLEALYQRILAENYSPEAIAIEHDFQEVIFKQEQNGVYFDLAAAKQLYQELTSERAKQEIVLQEAFPPKRVEEIFIPKVNNKKRGYVKGVPFTKVRYEEFNPSSRQQIAERLQEKYGWKPSEFTDKGAPRVDEEVLKTLPYPECPALITWLELLKIMGMIGDGNNAWLKLVDSTSHIHGRVNTCGAVTGRCTHNSPNLAQIPARGNYGKKCRALFAAPDGLVQVGADASGLELRMLAHYMAKYDGGKYGKIILEGDIHTANQEAAGLPTRDDAKRFAYAFLYGAGDEKIGSIISPLDPPSTQAKKGKAIKNKFFRATPAIKALVDAVQGTLKGPDKRKFLYGIDRRKLHVRSAHSALNTLLQSAGAVLVKFATILFHIEAKKKGWIYGKDFVQVLHVHDECQFNCKPDIAEEIGSLFVKCIELAGKHFGMRCPTTGEYKIGKNWAETH